MSDVGQISSQGNNLRTTVDKGLWSWKSRGRLRRLRRLVVSAFLKEFRDVYPCDCIHLRRTGKVQDFWMQKLSPQSDVLSKSKQCKNRFRYVCKCVTKHMRSICLCLCIRIYTACTCTYNSDWQALDVCDSCKLSNMLWAFERQTQTILFVLGFRKIALPCCSFTSFTVLRWNGSSPKNARNVKRCEEVCRRSQLQAVRIAHDIGRICINWTEQHTSVDAWCVNDVLSVAGHEKPLEEEVLAAETCFANTTASNTFHWSMHLYFMLNPNIGS